MATEKAITADRSNLTRFAWLSIGAAVTTITLKITAYLLTGSIGLLSDAIESGVNLIGAIMALGMLSVAARPADEEHAFGHNKAEYFSSIVEGILILIAAISIIWTSVGRLINPQPLESLGIGLLVSVGASVLNLVVGQILIRTGKKNNSITLEADGHHLMTDVWTSAAVILGVGLVALTGWLPLDSLVAICAALNIIYTGVNLVRRSVAGMMDVSLPDGEMEAIEKVMTGYREKGAQFHSLRTRQAASMRFIAVHMLVPGKWNVHDAHHLAEKFEKDIEKALGEVSVITHLEPIEDEISTAHLLEK